MLDGGMVMEGVEVAGAVAEVWMGVSPELAGGEVSVAVFDVALIHAPASGSVRRGA